MNKGTIQTIDLCSSAPELPFPMVDRPHIVQTITQIFDSKAEVVIIEGDFGCGKTVILKEFWDEVDSPCFGIFLGNTNRPFFQSIYARMELSCQLYGYINERNPPNDIDLTEGELRTLWQKCARKLNRKRQFGYVIVDGIYHFPGTQNSIKQSILDLLPLGVNPFKCVFSNCVDGSSIVDGIKYSTKIFMLPNFALYETNLYLNDVVKDKKLRKEYHYATTGLPSKLASIRRQIEANFSDQLDVSSDIKIESLFEAEWNQIQSLSQETSTVLSILLAFGGVADLSTVAANCSIDQKEIEKIFDSLQFLKLNTKSSCWEFSHDSFRRFAEKKLQHTVHSATETIARDFLENPASHHSILSLPRYLDQIKSVETLRQLLGAKRIASILLEHKSATVVEPTLKQAVEICLSSKHISALTVFSIIRSTIQQILRSSGNVHEIQARCALGDYEGALTIANDAPLHAQRLRSLSKLASSLAENPSYPTQPLINEIVALCKQINFSDLHPDKAIEIAAELYPLTPKLSLKILKELSQDESEDSNFELAIARITLETIIHKEMGLSIERDSQIPLAENSKSDNQLRELIKTYTAFGFVKSANEVLEAIQEISGISERLFVQRKWISQNPNRADAIDVIENAINEAISTIEYAPNATFYREIATPLPDITDLIRRKKIINVLHGLLRN